MEHYQFALYQMKDTPENRELRFRPYETFKEYRKQVRCENYQQSYLGQMRKEDTPEIIRERLEKHPPRSLRGRAVSVSDVLVLNQGGEVTAYYIEKEGFTVIDGFIHMGSSSALISMDTADFHIEGKEGNWMAYDNIVIEGREFFLMEHSVYGTQAANVILDANGVLVMDNVLQGFDDAAKQQIQNFINPPEALPEPEKKMKEKPERETWQKSYENGEYLRSAEITEEQNYNMIDGRMNNLPMKPRKIGKRISVLDRLHLKQAEIARRSGKPVSQMAAEIDIERRRK